MDDKILEVKIEEKQLNYIEYLYYEKIGYEEIVNNINRSIGKYAHNRETCDFYGSKFIAANAALNMALMELVYLHIIDPSIDKDKVYASVSFSSGMASFYLQNPNGGGCSCSL